jgi:hypothetical protein
MKASQSRSMTDASLNDYSVARTITVSGLPRSENGKWKGVSVTPVVIASALHRAYGVHTNPGMVTMGQRSCKVELGSEREQLRVLKLYQKGVEPTLHSSDRTPKTLWSLKIMAGSSTLYSPYSAEETLLESCSDYNGQVKDTVLNPGEVNEVNTHISAVLEISGLPAGENKVKTAFVMASMVHNTFGVQTDPSNVRFSTDQTKFWIDLGDFNAAKHVVSMVASGVAPVLHTKDSHYPARLQVSSAFIAPKDAAVSNNQDVDLSIHSSWLSAFTQDESEKIYDDSTSPTCTGPAFDSFFSSWGKGL